MKERQPIQLCLRQIEPTPVDPRRVRPVQPAMIRDEPLQPAVGSKLENRVVFGVPKIQFAKAAVRRAPKRRIVPSLDETTLAKWTESDGLPPDHIVRNSQKRSWKTPTVLQLVSC